MLELKNINKEYAVGDFKQQALKDINLKFRENEFVSILGQSGSGKTTSLRTLDPKTTFIIDCDGKGLPWRGWKKRRSYRHPH